MERHDGGCSCGAVRFALGRPLWVTVCHCNACKKRTGSAFGLSLVVDDTEVREFSGATTTFSRVGDSGRQVHYEFCPRCGTTIRWRVELIANRHVYAAGTLDDPTVVKLICEMYAGEALPFARLGSDLSCSGAPNDDFRAAAMERTKSLWSSG
jgi:hypothetical protein